MDGIPTASGSGSGELRELYMLNLPVTLLGGRVLPLQIQFYYNLWLQLNVCLNISQKKKYSHLTSYCLLTKTENI